MMAAYPGSSGSGSARRAALGSPQPPLERSASSTGVSRRTDTVSLREFLRSHALPALVRITTGEQRSAELRTQVDLSRPVLLYRVYQSVKIHARSLMRSETGDLEEVGPAIVIPEGYRGWFSLLSEDGKTAPYYSSIEEVAAARLAVFLSRHDVPAYVMTDNGQGTVYRKVMVGAGNVLRLMGVFRDLNTPPSGTPALNYAQCVNYKNEVLFLPFTAEGRFYAAATRPTSSRDHVFLMSQLMRQQRTPMTLKLVCGFMPRMPCNFTGLLRLEEVRPERLVLGCTTESDGPGTLFELDAESALRVQPIDQLDRRSSPAFTRALVMCERHGELWRHQMKVSHDVFDSAHSSFDSLEAPPAGRLRKTPSLSERFGRTVVAPAVPVPLSPRLGKPPTPQSETKKKLTKSPSLDGERRPGRSLRQTVSRFFLNRSRGSGNRDVTTSFVFSRPADVQYGRVADDITPPPPATPTAENLYAEICEKDERGRVVHLRSAATAVGGPPGDYTLRLGSDGQSSSPSSPGHTMEHSTC
ncbi:uncharacterized protein LOC122386283 [Amphibalanus amphitrite]|uniref:uncharacterized protein LOC122386283 n=1 Tax=Amphibalanus amphitrite TaxID=1232801 RepID=UPI001C92B033|nr:uncharacterized protein LOC122386283 [Amphibalanus amphitrite]